MNRKKPTALRLVDGNAGKRPLPENEPMPELGADMPEGMSPAAQKNWPVLSKQLTDAGVLTRMDALALAMLCEIYARWVDAKNKVVEFGLVIKAPSGFPVQSPYLSIATRAEDQMKALLIEFGMTPAGRTKVHTVKRGKAETEKPKPAAAYFTGPRN